MGPIYHLRELLPDPESILQLEIEELGEVLLAAILRSGATQVSRHNFMLSLTENNPPYQGPIVHRLAQPLAEAWAWLESHCLLVAKPTDQHWQVLSRRAQTLTTPEAFAAFKGASTFPRSLLHPAVDREAWQSFNRGRFDSAIFEAFREVEIAVREAADFSQHEHGVAMVRRAFHKETGPLTDMTVDDAEREATSNLFAGAVGSYKNPGSHRRVGREDVAEAGELLMLASHLLRVVEDRRYRREPNKCGHGEDELEHFLHAISLYPSLEQLVTLRAIASY